MTKSNDIICPDCKAVIGLKNVLAFDEDEMDIFGIVYAIKCKKCDCLFITPMRFSKKMTKKQKADCKKMLDNIDLGE